MNAIKWAYNTPVLLVMLATLFWGGNAIAGKLAVGHVSPFLLTSLRWLIAVIVLTPFALTPLKADWHRIRPQLLLMFALGAVGFTVFNNLMYLALTATSAINVAIIQSAMPLFVFMLSALFFAVKVNKLQLIGSPITIFGVLVIAFQGRWSFVLEHSLNYGDLIMLMAVFAYGVYSVFLSKKPNIHWLSTMVVLASAALLSSIPFTVFEGVSGRLTLPDLTGWSVVLYTAVFASIGSQVFWIRSVELIGANTTSVYINLVPLFGSLLAVLLLG